MRNLLAIVAAEYILRWRPRGTHRWDRFVTPDELRAALSAAGTTPGRAAGIVYNPLAASWRLSGDTAVNYLLGADRPA